MLGSQESPKIATLSLFLPRTRLFFVRHKSLEVRSHSYRAVASYVVGQHERGRVLVLGGPSCVGKTTLQRLLSRNDFNSSIEFRPLLTCTTRLPRRGETDGIDYRFMTQEAYDAAGPDMEERTCYNGIRYGTLREDLDKAAHAPPHVITVAALDAVGLHFFRRRFGGAESGRILGVFLKASLPTLEARLQARGTDSLIIAQRLSHAASTELTPEYERLFESKVCNENGQDLSFTRELLDSICKDWLRLVKV